MQRVHAHIMRRHKGGERGAQTALAINLYELLAVIIA